MAWAFCAADPEDEDPGWARENYVTLSSGGLNTPFHICVEKRGKRYNHTPGECKQPGPLLYITPTEYFGYPWHYEDDPLDRPFTLSGPIPGVVAVFNTAGTPTAEAAYVCVTYRVPAGYIGETEGDISYQCCGDTGFLQINRRQRATKRQRRSPNLSPDALNTLNEVFNGANWGGYIPVGDSPPVPDYILGIPINVEDRVVQTIVSVRLYVVPFYSP